MWFLAHRVHRPGNSVHWRNRDGCAVFNGKERGFVRNAFLAVVMTAAIVACSNLGQTSGINVGPNFPSKTLYATNSNQNAISIYSGSKSGGGPVYNIGGAQHDAQRPAVPRLRPPQEPLGDQLQSPAPKGGAAGISRRWRRATWSPWRPHPSAGGRVASRFTPKNPSPTPSSSASPQPDLMIITDVDPTIKYPSQVLLFIAGTIRRIRRWPDPSRTSSFPPGRPRRPDRLYVTNIQGRSVEQFVLPTPSADPQADARRPRRRRRRAERHRCPTPSPSVAVADADQRPSDVHDRSE